MSSSGNTIGILVPQPSAPAMVSQGSANPPEPLTNAAGPVDVIEMVADVASSALSLVAPDSAAANVADAVSDVVSLASMVPGLPSVRLPSRKMVSGFGGGSGAGSDGGVVTWVMVTVFPVRLQQLSVILSMPYSVSKYYLMKQRLTLHLTPRFHLFGSAATIPTK